jgi:hypothetical protein
MTLVDPQSADTKRGPTAKYQGQRADACQWRPMSSITVVVSS